jgi:hypothetical protein
MSRGGGSSGGELPVDEHCRREPAERLRPYVAWYTGYRQRGVPPARHRGGSRGFAARDPEGNRWSFGTYRGEPRKT